MCSCNGTCMRQLSILTFVWSQECWVASCGCTSHLFNSLHLIKLRPNPCSNFLLPSPQDPGRDCSASMFKNWTTLGTSHKWNHVDVLLRFLKIFYLKCRKRERKTQGKRRKEKERGLVVAATAGGWYRRSRESRTPPGLLAWPAGTKQLVHLSLIPRRISRELERKQTSWDSKSLIS